MLIITLKTLAILLSKVGIGEDGVCTHCGRNTSTIVEDQSEFVPDTEMN
jgi:hypothetical protein